jgi:DNA (cytosine-5)-methyltransferase 1
VTYTIQDFIYIRPEFFSPVEGQGANKAGRNVGLKPYVVCQLLSINAPAAKKADPESARISVRRLYRPEDISSDKAYCSDIREVCTLSCCSLSNIHHFHTNTVKRLSSHLIFFCTFGL